MLIQFMHQLLKTPYQTVEYLTKANSQNNSQMRIIPTRGICEGKGVIMALKLNYCQKGIMITGNCYIFIQKLTIFLSCNSLKLDYAKGEKDNNANFLIDRKCNYNTGDRKTNRRKPIKLF